MFLVVLGPEIINIVHECTSGLKFGLWVPPVLDLPLYVLTAPQSHRHMRNNVLDDVLVGLDQKVLVRIVVQRRSTLLRGHVRLETHSVQRHFASFGSYQVSIAAQALKDFTWSFPHPMQLISTFLSLVVPVPDFLPKDMGRVRLSEFLRLTAVNLIQGVLYVAAALLGESNCIPALRLGKNGWAVSKPNGIAATH